MKLKRVNAAPLFLLSLVFPGVGFLFSLKRIWDKQYHKIILLFFFWFGYSIMFYGGDIQEYKDAFPITANYTWNDFFYLLSHIFSDDKWTNYQYSIVISKPDIYSFTLQFIVSRFTDELRWFFAFASVIYAYIFLQFINEVLRISGIRDSKPWKIFFASLLLIVPFYVGVSGIRFWPALFWFLLFVLKYFRTKKFVNIAFAAVSVLFHYSFIIPIAVLLVFTVVRTSKIFLRVVVVFTIIFFAISTTTGLFGFANEAIGIFGENTISEVAGSYTDEEAVNEHNEGNVEVNWYVTARQVLMTYSFMSIFLLDFFGVFKWRTSKYLDSWFPLYVLFFCISMLTYNLGSIGRFMYVFQLLCVIRLLILSSINYKSKALNIIANLLLPVILIHALLSFRSGFYFVDPLLFVGNPIVFFLVHSTTSLSELLVGH